MVLISFQILLINFVVAGLITALIYCTNKRVRMFNPILLFIVSSIGTFSGTVFAMLLPELVINSDSIFLNNLILSIPGIALSLLFTFLWVKGSKSEGYV